MGRGRAKAKQTKVARDLKYNSPGMDLDRLKADLGATDRPADVPEAVDDDDDDPYADDDDDGGDRWAPAR